MIGVVGGGQLAMLLVEAGKKRDVDVVVQTASKWQVREPINADSVSKWKKYEEHLPLELISAYPK